MGETQRDSWWTRWGHKLLLRSVVLQMAAVVAFAGLLLIGERSHASFFALYVPRQPLLLVVLVALVTALVLKRRGLLGAQVVLCLVVLFPVMGTRVSFPRAHAGTEHTIRLATYNVHFGKDGRPQLLDELAAMPVDLLALQATYDSIGDRLRERFPDRAVRQEGELVLVSRWPILDMEVPPPLPGDVRPMWVGYLVQTPDGPLRVFITHPFSPRNALVDHDERWSVDVERREAQVAAVVAASRRPGPPFVIAGDTNLPHLSSIARSELGHLDDAFERAGTGLGYTFPAKRPWLRIDRVLAGPGIRFTSIRVGPRGASDHRPLFVDFEHTAGGS